MNASRGYLLWVTGILTFIRCEIFNTRQNADMYWFGGFVVPVLGRRQFTELSSQ
ncbi:hypothetical protein KCP70_22975 [Salmonella enterica subsp. enterica]|nr:hypothetical protein KCP70_22975 [Salmonella enterica subsp. enterica]